jgi:hypothetical protein
MMVKHLRDTKHLFLKPTANGLRKRRRIHQTHGIKRIHRQQEDITRALMVLCQVRNTKRILPSNTSNLLRLHLNPTASQRRSNDRNNNSSSSSSSSRVGHSNRQKVPASRPTRNRTDIKCKEHHNSHTIMQLPRRLQPGWVGHTSHLHQVEEDRAQYMVQAMLAHTRMRHQ